MVLAKAEKMVSCSDAASSLSAALAVDEEVAREGAVGVTPVRDPGGEVKTAGRQAVREVRG